MIKSVICDVDGTLLPYGESAVDENIISKLRQIQQKGVRVAIASGRSYNDLCRLFAELGGIYFIANDGSLSVCGGKTVFHKPISGECCRSFINHYKAVSDSVVLYGKNNCYVFGNCADFAAEKPISVTSFFAIHEQIYKLGAYGGVQKEMFPLPSELRLCRKRPTLVEYVSLYADKGIAVSDFQIRFFLSKYDTAAIGNEQNDIKMLKNAAYSAAMSNSEESVLSSASMKVQSSVEFLDFILDKLQ